MRLRQLIERTEPRIMYHGTSAENARSILKHGLVPNRRSTDAGIEWTSLEGVYFTDRIEKALRSAYAANGYDSSKPILVVAARIVPRSGIPDEDKLHALIDQAWRQIVPDMGGEYADEAVHPYEAFEETPDQTTQDAIVDRIAEDVHGAIGLKRQVPYELFRKYVEEMPTESGDFLWDNFADTKDRLARYYRSASNLLSLGYTAQDLRITQPVTFRGRNAILAIAERTTGEWNYLYDRSSGRERELIHSTIPPSG